ncbi:RHS repeat-associated core domain-containing protein [Vallitalea guaymasensis]|uniref:RHS repeat-associated core domain-containing protein n=1 Tax=Vallitalea guaymasensis TaxID=1185412 RepID=UPI000DE2D68D|nr:RHS repeat-associated core domain-containing protein [Vallitalea guaymasensis]
MNNKKFFLFLLCFSLVLNLLNFSSFATEIGTPVNVNQHIQEPNIDNTEEKENLIKDDVINNNTELDLEDPKAENIKEDKQDKITESNENEENIIFNSNTINQENFELNHNITDKTISVSVIYTDELLIDNLHYKYKIDDKESEWVDTNSYIFDNLNPTVQYSIEVKIKDEDNNIYKVNDKFYTDCETPALDSEELDAINKMKLIIYDNNAPNTKYQISCNENQFLDNKGNIVTKGEYYEFHHKEVIIDNLENKSYSFKIKGLSSNGIESDWSENINIDIKEEQKELKDKSPLINLFDFEQSTGEYTISSDTQYKNGNYSLKLEDKEIILPSTTEGYSNVMVSFNISTMDFENQLCIVHWFDGYEWNIMDRIPQLEKFEERTYLLPPNASDNPNFKIRFQLLNKKLSSSCFIDDIKVEGTIVEDMNNKMELDSITKVQLESSRNDDLEVNNYNNSIYPKNMYELGKETPFVLSDIQEENINPKSGNVQLSYNDIVLKGKNGLDFVLNRYYTQSQSNIIANLVYRNAYGQLSEERNLQTYNDRTYNIGAGWAFDLPSLETQNGSYPILHYGKKGTFIPSSYFRADTYESYIFKDYKPIDIQLVVDWDKNKFSNGVNTSSYYLIEPDGIVYYFNDEGRLIGKVDKYGNSIKFYHKKMTDAYGSSYWVLSRIIDSCNREINFNYNYSSNKILINVNDGKNINTIQYNFSRIVDETSKTLDGFMPNSEIVLKSVIDMENYKTSFDYNYEVIKASMLNTNLDEAEKNMYVNLSYVTHPSGIKNFYYYRKYNRDFGPNGKREYYRLQIRRDILSNDLGSGSWINTRTYSYNINPYADLVKTTVSQNMCGTSLTSSYDYEYGKLMTKEEKGEDHKYIEQITYDDYDLLKQTKLNKYNLSTNKSMEIVNDYTYDSWKHLINTWDEQSIRDSNSTLVNPDTDRHKTTYTYSKKYNLLLKKEYWQDEAKKIKIENILSSDEKSIEWSNTYVNNTLKEKKRYFYDSYGNIIEIRNYIADQNFTTYISEKYSYQDNSSRNYFNGTYLTKKWKDNVKDANNNLIEGINGVSQGTISEDFYYDNVGNIIKYIDGQGNSTLYTYDKNRRKTSQTNADNSSIRWDYSINTSDNSVTITNENGYKIKRNYDSAGRLVNILDVQSSQMLKRIAYINDNSLIKEIIDGEGNRTVNEYYSDSRLKSNKLSDKNNSTIEDNKYYYDDSYDNGTLSIERTESRKKTYFADKLIETKYRDKSGYLTKSNISFDDKTLTTTYSHDFLGNVTQIKDPRANGESYTEPYTTKNIYDYKGRILNSYNINGNYISNIYNSIGQLIQKRDILGNESSNQYGTLYNYDEVGRLIKEKIPFEKEGSTIYYQIIKYYYDNNNNLIKKEMTNNNLGENEHYIKQTYKYDNRNNLIQTTLYNNNSIENLTQYYYDKVGNQIRTYTGLTSPLIINGLDNITSTGDTTYSVTKYEYDHMNRMIKKTDPLNNQESYAYDTNNRLINKTDRNENVYTYSYKGSNLQSEQVKDSNEIADIKQYNWGYGHTLLSIEDNSNNKIDYTYDEFNRLLKETEGNITKDYTYDENSNIVNEIIKDGSTLIKSTKYVYDKLNRLAQVIENGNIEATYTYDLNGNRQSLSYANGNKIEYKYNLANRIKEITIKNHDNIINKYQYSYQLDGNQISEKEPLTGKETKYEYDTLGRLKAETNLLNESTNKIYAYTYDDYNNRKSLIVSGNDQYTTKYYYNLNNQLIKDEKLVQEKNINTNIYTYDPNGNSITKITKVPEHEDILETRNYDLYNRLKGINSNNKVIEYTYNLSGARNSKTINDIRTDFVFSGNNIIGEKNNSNYTTYIRGINLIATVVDNNKNYYLFNGHGNVTGLTDVNGDITKQYNYDAFGVEQSPDENDNNPFRYCGEYLDKETGNIYLRARYYNPIVGRFVTEDSYSGQANDPLSLNLYTYCHNNPVMFVDPSGHTDITADLFFEGTKETVIGTGSKAFPLVVFAAWLFDQFSIDAGETNEQIAEITIVENKKEPYIFVLEQPDGSYILTDFEEINEPFSTEGISIIQKENPIYTSPMNRQETLRVLYALKKNYPNGVYEDASYHGKVGNSVKSKAPTDGQDALNNSISIGPNTDRRIAVSNGEFVVLDKTREGLYHGHVRGWDDLSQQMQSALRKENLVTKKGKIK